jgi:hypothetical protein
MNARAILGSLLLSLVSLTAEAGPSVLPEPGVLGLLAIGAVAGVVVAIRKRKK